MKYFLISVGFFFLTACVDSKTADKKTVPRKLTPYELNSCFRYDEGPSPVENFSQELVKTDFGKTYDRSQVMAIMSASAKDTVSFISDRGVDLRAIHRPSRGCHRFFELGAPPSHLVTLWDYIDAAFSDIFLSGVFLNKVAASEQGGAGLPMIVIRTDSDRWALVHEFMHFLFSSHRTVDGFDEAAFLKDWQVVNQQAETSLNFLNESQLDLDPNYRQQMVNLWLDLANKSITYLKISYLEEMSIESNLRRLYKANLFARATGYNNEHAIVSIGRNYREAQKVFEKIANLGATLSQYVQKHQMSDAQQKMTAMTKQWTDLRKQADRLYTAHAFSGDTSLGSDRVSRCGHLYSHGLNHLWLSR